MMSRNFFSPICSTILAVFVGIALYPLLPLYSKTSQDPCDVFSRIYKTGEWGRNAQGEGISGMGSLPSNAIPYLSKLQEFIIKYRIQSVVDVGCGDWELSKLINWGSITYYGYDAAEEVIENDIARYGNDDRHFVACDAIHADLPEADLMICKDVLQHLPNSFIHDFISQLRKYKYCLIVNDIGFEARYDRKLNHDIPMGSGRCVDLTKPPFNVEGVPFMRYFSDGHTKEMLLIVRDSKIVRARH
jgi:SAM-dependent methyltransferase